MTKEMKMEINVERTIIKCIYKNISDYFDSANGSWYFPREYQCRVQEEIVPEENTYRITVCQNNSRAKKNKNGKRRREELTA
jgi:hypothetical protein